MKITEAQLSSWLPVGTCNPVREGWYLIACDDDEFWPSTPAMSPKFDIPDTVWRYWDGSKWMWHGPESFTPLRMMATAKTSWHDANVDGALWRGLAETFMFHTMNGLPR